MSEKEYEEVGANYRFFLRWRHAAAAGDLLVLWAVFSLCITASKEAPQLTWVIPLVASPFGILLWIVDVRTREIYHAAIRAGADLEGKTGGFYTRIRDEVALAKGMSLATKLTQSLALNVLFIGSSAMLLLLSLGLLLNSVGIQKVAQTQSAGTSALGAGSTALSVIFDGLVALGTIGLALVTVFQDRIRARLGRPQVQIVPHRDHQCYKCPLLDSQGRVIPTFWFGLAVNNVRPSRPALASQVLLETMYRWNATDKRWEENSPPIPYPFVWAPGHLRNASVTIRRNAVFDFGRISMPVMAFAPELQYSAIGYDPSLQPEVTGLYVLRVEAEHLAQGPRQVWQVTWNGAWDEDPKDMTKHVQIREISVQEFEKCVRHDVPIEDGH
jgi:hypothetical protein